jgi:hypothetical protein
MKPYLIRVAPVMSTCLTFMDGVIGLQHTSADIPIHQQHREWCLSQQPFSA